MTAEEIVSFHDERPFRPFVIHLADGRSFVVHHPEFLTRSPDVSVLFYFHDGRRHESLDRELITSLEQAKDAPKAKPRQKR